MTEEKEIQVTAKQITIYCNNCKKEIEKVVIPEDDGYYPDDNLITSNDFYIKCHVKYNSCQIEPKGSKQHLCPECRKNLFNKINSVLSKVEGIFKEFNIDVEYDTRRK